MKIDKILLPNFLSIDYLQFGSNFQKHAYSCLLNIIPIFAKYNPILVGTIPININIDTSDLDVILECPIDQYEELIQHVTKHFSTFSQFSIEKLEYQDETIILGRFLASSMLSFEENPFELSTTFEIELFVQSKPTPSQNGYLHMIQEALILELFNRYKPQYKFQEQVIALKTNGMKTEPAFAHLLQLSGDPYQSLLEFDVYDYFERQLDQLC